MTILVTSSYGLAEGRENRFFLISSFPESENRRVAKNSLFLVRSWRNHIVSFSIVLSVFLSICDFTSLGITGKST